jgi:hypothetical protein
VDERVADQEVVDQLAASAKAAAEAALLGISGARFPSRQASPWSPVSKPAVPISEPGGPSRICVVAAGGSSFRLARYRVVPTAGGTLKH